MGVSSIPSKSVADPAHGFDQRMVGVYLNALAQLGDVLVERSGLWEIVNTPALIEDCIAINHLSRALVKKPEDGGFPR